jgi:hypothetical protein
MTYAVHEHFEAQSLYADRPDDCGCSCARLGEIGCTAARTALSVTCIALTIIFGGCFVATGNPAFLGLTLASAVAAIVAWPFWGQREAHEAAAAAPVQYSPPVVVHHRYDAAAPRPQPQQQPLYPAPQAYYPPSGAQDLQRRTGVGDHQTPGQPPQPQHVYTPSAPQAYYPPPGAQDLQRRTGVGDHQTPSLPPPHVTVEPPPEVTKRDQPRHKRPGGGDHQTLGRQGPGIFLGFAQAMLTPPGSAAVQGMRRTQLGSHAPEAGAPSPYDPTRRAGVGDHASPL